VSTKAKVIHKCEVQWADHSSKLPAADGQLSGSLADEALGATIEEGIAPNSPADSPSPAQGSTSAELMASAPSLSPAQGSTSAALMAPRSPSALALPSKEHSAIFEPGFEPGSGAVVLKPAMSKARSIRVRAESDNEVWPDHEVIKLNAIRISGTV